MHVRATEEMHKEADEHNYDEHNRCQVIYHYSHRDAPLADTGHIAEINPLRAPAQGLRNGAKLHECNIERKSQPYADDRQSDKMRFMIELFLVEDDDEKRHHRQRQNN